MKRLALMLYYVLASHLPDRTFPGGELFRRMRQACVRRFLLSTGDWVNIESGVYLGSGSNIQLGNRSGFGRRSRILGAKVGDNVMIAPEVVILCRNHRRTDRRLSIREQGYEAFAVPIIEDDVWLGIRAIVLPGVRIGRGAIVGAGSVVTHDVEPFSTVAGNPAMVIARR